jgi:hypothetical protein
MSRVRKDMKRLVRQIKVKGAQQQADAELL